MAPLRRRPRRGAGKPRETARLSSKSLALALHCFHTCGLESTSGAAGTGPSSGRGSCRNAWKCCCETHTCSASRPSTGKPSWMRCAARSIAAAAHEDGICFPIRAETGTLDFGKILDRNVAVCPRLQMLSVPIFSSTRRSPRPCSRPPSARPACVRRAAARAASDPAASPTS